MAEKSRERWGFALWNFEGPFGIVAHGRPGARFERRGDYLVDIDLLELLLAARLT
jgi:endoglucanase